MWASLPAETQHSTVTPAPLARWLRSRLLSLKLIQQLLVVPEHVPCLELQDQYEPTAEIPGASAALGSEIPAALRSADATCAVL